MLLLISLIEHTHIYVWVYVANQFEQVCMLSTKEYTYKRG